MVNMLEIMISISASNIGHRGQVMKLKKYLLYTQEVNVKFRYHNL